MCGNEILEVQIIQGINKRFTFPHAWMHTILNVWLTFYHDCMHEYALYYIDNRQMLSWSRYKIYPYINVYKRKSLQYNVMNELLDIILHIWYIPYKEEQKKH